MKYENKIPQVDELNKELAKLRPVSPALLRQIKEYFRIGLTYSSNALEGNTLTETETKVVLEDGLTIAGKPLRDHYEASGHSDAFDLVWEISGKKSFSEKQILNIHKLFYYRLDTVNVGVYRRVPAVITGTDYLSPSPAKVHAGIVDIHPFVDGNGRTARLLMNLVLFQAGYSITIIPPILRADYIELVKRAQTGPKDDTDFMNFISCMVYESTKDYLRLLKGLA